MLYAIVRTLHKLLGRMLLNKLANSHSYVQEINCFIWSVKKVRFRVLTSSPLVPSGVRWIQSTPSLSQWPYCNLLYFCDEGLLAPGLIHQAGRLSIRLSMGLQPIVGPWPLFQFLNPIHSRQDSSDGGSARRKAATYTQNNTNTE
jgi:hypothetical protein